MLQEYVYELKEMLSIMLPWKQLPGAGRQHNSPKTQISLTQTRLTSFRLSNNNIL